MIRADISFVLTHLWQSTFCVFAAWLLTLALKNNRASARYWVWLAASVKFLIPFSLLVSASSELGSRMLPSREQPQVFSVMEEISRPLMLSNPTPMLSGSAHTFHPVLAFLFGVWLCGFVIAAIYWLMSWRRIRAALRSATPLHLNLSIPAMSFPGGWSRACSVSANRFCCCLKASLGISHQTNWRRLSSMNSVM
jgi:beta-lactamase regulating signal transducer with metallopeptidase domain